MRTTLSFAGLLLIAACGDEGADAPKAPAASSAAAVTTGGSGTTGATATTGVEATSDASDASSDTSDASATIGTSEATVTASSTTAGGPSTTATAVGGASGSDTSASGSASQPLTFEADIWPVFEQTREPPFVYPGGTTYGGCTVVGVCHGGERAGAGLRMPDPASAYAALIDVPSNSDLCAGTLRVVAGNPDQSCLILFYEGRLRDELDWVDQSEIDLVREWIVQGALP